MKKICCILLICCLIHTFSACQTPAPETSPSAPESQTQPGEIVLEGAPDMTVTWPGGSITVRSGNYSWTSLCPNGEMNSVVACGKHLLDSLDKEEFHAVTGKKLTLSFPVEPDELVVTRWSGSDTANIDAIGEQISLSDLVLSVEPGRWVYEITAVWNRESWSGSASYHLYISR